MKENLIRLGVSQFLRLNLLMGIRISVHCPRREEQQRIEAEARDQGRAQLQENLRVSQEFARSIRFVHLSTRILTQRVVAEYWARFGHYLTSIAGLQINQSQYSYRWGRLGGKLRQHKAYLRSLGSR